MLNRILKYIIGSARKLRPFVMILAAAAAGFAASGCLWLQDLRVGILPIIAASAFLNLPLAGSAVGVALGLAFQGQSGWIRIPSLLVLVILILILKKFSWSKNMWVRLGMLTLAQSVTLLFLRGQGFMMILLGLETLSAWGVAMALIGAGGHITRTSPLTLGNAAICLTVSAAVLLSGLPGVYDGPFAPCMLFMSVIMMAASSQGGPAVGAASGLALGMLAALASRAPWIAAGAMAMGAMLSAALSGLGRPIAALGYALGIYGLAILQSADPTRLIPYPSLLTACLIYSVIPEHWWATCLDRILVPWEENEKQQAGPLDEVRSKILHLSDCLQQLSGVFLEMASGNSGEQNELLEPLMKTVASQACQGCPRAKMCWDTHADATRKAFEAAVRSPGKRRVFWEEDFPQDFRSRCPRMNRIMNTMTGAYGLYRAHGGYQRRIEECRTLVGRQLESMAGVMNRLGGEMVIRIAPTADKQVMIRKILRENGLDPHGIVVKQDGTGRWSVTMQVNSCGGRRMCRAIIAPLLSKIFMRPMLPEEGCCGGVGGMCQLTFHQTRVFRVESANMQKSAGAVCGDAVCHKELEGSGFFMAISDGMGVGAGAAQEAEATVRLLECFYEAGFDEEIIFHTINQVLLLRSAREMYATVDICLVDTAEGKAKFIKIGAPPSYILRGDEVITVSTPTLPLGILENVDPASITRVLQDGDVIVMVSDGLDGSGGWVEQILPSLGHLPPEVIAEELMQASHQWVKGEDDRSVVIARVSCPEQDEIAYFKRQRLQLWKARVGS